MRVLPSGEDAVLVELAGLAEVLGLDAALAAAAPRGVTETVPGARTLLVRFDPRATIAAVAGSVLREIRWAPIDLAAGGDLVEIPTTYDGPDLAEVAGHTGLTIAGVIAAHQEAVWTVGFIGFAPGFPYLVGGDPRLHVPRRTTPRVRVDAGSVALAGAYCGIYPTASPGGWQLIGRTEARLWNADRDPPALLAPGTRVRFVAGRR